jgi:hypothetical protein
LPGRWGWKSSWSPTLVPVTTSGPPISLLA